LALFAWAPAISATDVNLGVPIAIGAGPRALGMGGAFSAVADDATANTWNPAGMVQIERFEAAVSGGSYTRQVSVDGARDATFSQVAVDHVSLAAPFFVFGSQQTIGVAWQRQFDFTRRIAYHQSLSDPFATIENQVNLRQDGSFSSSSLSYAIEPMIGLSFGATAHLWADRWTGASSFTRVVRNDGRETFAGFSDDSVSSRIREETTVEEGYSATLGAWWQAAPWLTLALIYKPEYELRLRSRQSFTATTLDLTDPAATPVVSEGRSHENFSWHYPTSVTFGSAWRDADRQTIAFDVTWTQWSHYRQSDRSGMVSPVNTFIPRSEFSDDWSLRLGYERLFILSDVVIVGRVGALYERLPASSKAADTNGSSAADTHASVDEYFGGTLGASLCFPRILYDAAMQLRQGHGVGPGEDAPPDRSADVTSIVVRAGVTLQF